MTALAPLKQALKAAGKALVRAAGGVEAAAAFARPSKTLMGQYGDPLSDRFMPVDAVLDLESVTAGSPGWPIVTRFLALEQGFALVALPKGEAPATEKVCVVLGQVSKEAGEVMAHVLDAIGDGRITASEARAAMVQCTELAEAAMRLHALLDQIGEA